MDLGILARDSTGLYRILKPAKRTKAGQVIQALPDPSASGLHRTWHGDGWVHDRATRPPSTSSEGQIQRPDNPADELWARHDLAEGKLASTFATASGARRGGAIVIDLTSSHPRQRLSREWNNLVVKQMKADANPTTETTVADGWTVIAGGSAVETEVGKAAAFLTVISGFGKTVSVLAVFNGQAYVNRVSAFIGAIDLDKATAPANNTAAAVAPTLDQWGNLFIPPPTRQLTIADLVGNWGDNPGRISNNAIYSGQ